MGCCNAVDTAIKVAHEDSKTIIFTVKDTASGNVVDLTGYSAAFAVKASKYDKDSAAKIYKLVESLNAGGTIEINLTPTDTNIKPGVYRYGLKLTKPNFVQTILESSMHVSAFWDEVAPAMGSILSVTGDADGGDDLSVDLSNTMEVTVEVFAPQMLPGDKHTYVHDQAEAAELWVINHNLDFYPAVTTVDSARTEVKGQVNWPDANTVIIKFNGAFKGRAYLN